MPWVRLRVSAELALVALTWPGIPGTVRVREDEDDPTCIYMWDFTRRDKGKGIRRSVPFAELPSLWAPAGAVMVRCRRRDERSSF